MSWWLAGLVACSRSPSEVPAGERTATPNVLIVTVCSWRQDHVGLYGYPEATTPALDEFARSSVVFDNAWSNASITDSAHASMFTGMIPGKAGVLDFGDRVSQDVRTLPEILGVYGYRNTALLSSKDHMGPNTVDDMGRGFGSGDTPPDIPDALSRWIAADARPWLAWVHLRQAHLPYGNGAPFVDHVDPKVQSWLESNTNPRPAPPTGDPRRVRSPNGLLADALEDASVKRNFMAVYDSGMRKADDVFGALLARLETDHRLENTLVIFAGDHGETLGEDGMFGHQGLLVEHVLRVPLLVRMPGVSPHHESGRVSLVDLLPTVMEVLGIPSPAGLDGQSLLPALRGQGLTPLPVVAQGLAPVGDANKVDLREAVLEGDYWLSVLPSGTLLWRHVGSQWLEVHRQEPEQLQRMQQVRAQRGGAPRWSGHRPAISDTMKEELRKNGYW